MTIRFIDLNTLRQITPTRGLHPGRILYRLHEYYCKPMFARGKCDYNCAVTCETGLQRIFRSFENPNDPEALAVWRMREAIAKTMEAPREVKVEETVFGEPKFENVFEFLAEEYNEG